MRSIILGLALAAATAAFGDDCQHFADRDASLSANGVTRVVIVGRTGFVHVTGAAAAKTIRVDGRACAAIEEILVGIRLKTTRIGNTVRIEAEVPKEKESLFAAAPHLDLTIALPRRIAVEAAVPMGEVMIRDVATARVAVGEGAVTIRNIRGPVTIDEHRKGKTVVTDVGGDLVIRKPIVVDYKRIAGRVISTK